MKNLGSKNVNTCYNSDNRANIETIGVEPIPDKMRNMSAYTLLVMWLVTPASASAPLIGFLLYNAGFYDFLLLILLSTLLGIIPGVIMTEMGRTIPLISVVASRLTFGTGGSILFSVVFSILSLSWFAVSFDVGIDILRRLLDFREMYLFIFMGISEFILVLFGVRLMEKLYYFSASFFIIMYGYLTYHLITRFGFSLPLGGKSFNWGNDIDLLLTAGILGWAFEFSTISRFCKRLQSNEGSIRKILYMLAPSVGVMTAIFFFGTVGMISYHITGHWNIAIIGTSHSLFSTIAAFGVVLSIISHNAMNLYPSITKVVYMVNEIIAPHPLIQPSVALALTGLGTVLAMNNILSHYETYLQVAGAMLFPFTFIFIVDWYTNERYKMALSDFSITPGTCRDIFLRPAPLALLCFLFGVVLSYYKLTTSYWMLRYVPWEYCSSVLSGVIYYIALKLLGHRYGMRS
ncbi:hypothetical protein HAP94_17675 [Acidithiobacillus ferrivorans]|nr:hypothetical protein [Acidithiobacillus ferrivorans]